MDPALIETIRAIGTKEMRDILVRLLSHVRRKTALWPLPPGQTAEDIVDMAWERLIKARKWDKTAKPDLLIHLQGIVNSILTKHGLYGRKKDLPLARTMEPAEAEQAILLQEEEDDVEDPGNRISPLDAEAAWRTLDEEISGDRELQDVVAAIRLNAGKPSEIAEITGYRIERVYELQRKLAGYVQKARAKFLAYEQPRGAQ